MRIAEAKSNGFMKLYWWRYVTAPFTIFKPENGHILYLMNLSLKVVDISVEEENYRKILQLTGSREIAKSPKACSWGILMRSSTGEVGDIVGFNGFGNRNECSEKLAEWRTVSNTMVSLYVVPKTSKKEMCLEKPRRIYQKPYQTAL